MFACDPAGPLMVHVSKLLATVRALSFQAVCCGEMLLCTLSQVPVVVVACRDGHRAYDSAQSDGTGFHALGRVLSGTLRRDQKVLVLGERYTVDDEEDMIEKVVSELWLPEARCVKSLFRRRCLVCTETWQVQRATQPLTRWQVSDSYSARIGRQRCVDRRCG